MADQDIRFTFLADVSDFINNTKAATRSIDRFGDEAETAGRKAEQAFEESQRGTRAVKEAVDGLGLPFGRLIDNVVKLREVAARTNGRTAVLLGTLGAVTVAAKATAVAIGLVSTALVGTALSAASLNDELQPLRDAGALRQLSPEQARDIEGVRTSMEALKVAASDLSIQLGTVLAPAIADVLEWLTETSVGATVLIEDLQRLGNEITEVGQSISLNLDVGVAGRSISEMAGETDGLGASTFELLKGLRLAGVEYGELADKIEEARGKAAEIARAQKDVEEAHASAAREVKGATFEYDKALEALSALKAEAIETAAAISGVATAAGGGAVGGGAEAAALAIRKALAGSKDSEAIGGDAIFDEGSILDQAAFIGSQIESIFGAVAGIADRVLADRVEAFQATTDRIAEIDARLSGDVSDNEKKRLETRREALAQRQAAEREAALEAFNAQKAVAIAQAVIGASVAVIQAFAQLGPIAGAVAAIAVGAVTGIQIGLIASEQPSFHSGGMARDEVVARILQDETVVTAQDTRNAGGPQGVLDRVRGGGGDRVVPVLQLSGTRMIDEAARRAQASKSGDLYRAVRGQRPGSHRAAGLRDY